MNYIKFKELQVKAINDFPLFFAENDVQFAKGCEYLDITDPSKELTTTGDGIFLRKADVAKFRVLRNRLILMMNEALLDYDFLVDALVYELENHEYCKTSDPEPALRALSLTVDDVKESDHLQRALKAAIEQINFSLA